jgi:hypothetical protein
MSHSNNTTASDVMPLVNVYSVHKYSHDQRDIFITITFKIQLPSEMGYKNIMYLEKQIIQQMNDHYIINGVGGLLMNCELQT